MSRRSFSKRHHVRPLLRTYNRWGLHRNQRVWVAVFNECRDSVPSYYNAGPALRRWPDFVNACQGV